MVSKKHRRNDAPAARHAAKPEQRRNNDGAVVQPSRDPAADLVDALQLLRDLQGFPRPRGEPGRRWLEVDPILEGMQEVTLRRATEVRARKGRLSYDEFVRLRRQDSQASTDRPQEADDLDMIDHYEREIGLNLVRELLPVGAEPPAGWVLCGGSRESPIDLRRREVEHAYDTLRAIVPRIILAKLVNDQTPWLRLTEDDLLDQQTVQAVLHAPLSPLGEAVIAAASATAPRHREKHKRFLEVLRESDPKVGMTIADVVRAYADGSYTRRPNKDDERVLRELWKEGLIERVRGSRGSTVIYRMPASEVR